MKIFFLLRHSGYLRNYESVARLLAQKGHQVHLAFSKVRELYKPEDIEALAGESSNITYGIYPSRVRLWGPLATSVRVLQTYLRFLDKSYQNAPKLRQRAAALLPDFVGVLIRRMVGGNKKKIWLIIKWLRAIERAIPVDPKILEVVDSHNPDIFLVTPLIDLRASQLDWLKGAKRLGIKTGLCVASWDNLTNKSLIQLETDIVLVWNEFQKSEAIKLHRIVSSKIMVTGAQCYDRWFARRPSTPKESFLHQVGLNPDKPYILYLCSSRFIAPREVDFVVKWIKQLREHPHSRTRNLGVLIRPHPQNAAQWESSDLSSFENVVIYPREGANPVDENSVKDFFDSMYHCEAAVGINTSPMLEAGILEKPVFTVLAPEFSQTQEGTIHFHYLVKGGLLHLSGSLDQHFEQLSEVLYGPEQHKKRIARFVENFIRPQGLATPSTLLFVEAVENFCQHGTAQVNDRPLWISVLTVLLSPLALSHYGISRIAKSLK